MSEQYVQAVVARYMVNALESMGRYSSLNQGALDFLHQNYPFYDFKQDSAFDENAKKTGLYIDRLSSLIADWEQDGPSREYAKIETLAGKLGLDHEDIEIIRFGYALKTEPFLVEFICHMSNEVNWMSIPKQLSCFLNFPPSLISSKCLSSSKLINTGLIDVSFHRFGRGVDDAIALPAYLIKWIECQDDADILTMLCGTSVKSPLKYEHYDHIKDVRDTLKRFLEGSLHNRKSKGTNILVYGEIGTGKTEFAKVIAGHIGANLYAIGEECSAEDTFEISRDERLCKLKMAGYLLEDVPSAILLFDEMEDLLNCGYGPKKESKVFMNRLLETNAVPTIWVSNSINLFDTSFLRRMSFVVEMKSPPAHARKIIWDNICTETGFSMKPDDAEALSKQFDDPPAFIAKAINGAKVMEGGVSDISYMLNSMRKSVGLKPAAGATMLPQKFDESLVNVSMDLDALSRKLSNKGVPLNFSLCLYGASGTGKSAYARYLADRMGMDVSHIRASDILSPYVGATEENIANAFEDAAAKREFLIFDEADSFLSDRKNARNAWEITAINEMLTWMESHPYPFVCTTNLMDRIDNAALRRFTFKVKFDFLNQVQIKKAFYSFFNTQMPDSGRCLHATTIGDFSVVKKKAGLLGVKSDSRIIFDMLAEEAECRTPVRAPVGFLAKAE